jgi:hypothetical protein
MKTMLAVVAVYAASFQLQAQVSFTLSSSPAVGSSPQSVTAADINGDGKVDLISASQDISALSVLTNDGSGGFVLASTPSVGNQPFSVIAADVNGDGWKDLISANWGANTISVLTNNGSGGFATAGTYPVGSQPFTVTAADVNGDGKLDLICANSGANTLSVLTNNGSGGFALSSTPIVGNRPITVTSADVNGDGKPDLISANQNDATLSVLTNNGSGGFAAAGTYPVGNLTFCVSAADVNGDGKVDLISADMGSQTLTVLTNNGSGGFATAGTYPLGSIPECLTVADVNGDGKVDLIWGSQNANTVSVLTNNGSGGFVSASTNSVGIQAQGITAADVNGDGKVDLIDANYRSASLSILTNATPFALSPVINGQPQSQTVVQSTAAGFVVSASGATPLSYQWQFYGTNISGATNSSLVFTNAQLTNAGSYSVVVSNYLGITNSITAVLQVLPYGAPSIQVNGQFAVGTMIAGVSAQVIISNGYPGGFIFYTLDGSTPTTSSALYDGPFTLTNSAIVQALGVSMDFSQSSAAPPVSVQIIPVYTLQTSVIGVGTVTANPVSGPYASNSIVQLTASAGQYWTFDHWTGDATGNQNPISVTLDGPRSVQAVFVQTAYPLTLSTPGGGNVTANGQIISPATFYPVGSVVMLAATATNGWSFLGWQGNAGGADNPLYLTVSQTNNIQAIFGTTVTLNAVGGGSIALSQPNPVPFGTTLAASAVPNAGNFFVAWSGAAGGTNSPTTIVVANPNPILNALFSALPGGKFSLSVIVAGNGSVAISPQQKYYNPGDSVTLNASTTNTGTGFYGWTGDASGTNTSIMVVMNANKIVQANFAALPTVIISPLNLVVLVGSNAVLSASASGSPPFTYQWWNGHGPIAAATNATYTIYNAQLTNSDNYLVMVSNPFGSVTSAVATVTVLAPPVITAQPTNELAYLGGTASFSVVASGSQPLSYQWTFNTNNIPGATNAILVLNDVQMNQAGNYSVLVANPVTSVLSSNALLIVNPPPALGVARSSQLLLISWPTNASGFALQTTPTLSPANWISVSNPPAKIGNEYLESIPMTNPGSFYRLQFSGQ